MINNKDRSNIPFIGFGTADLKGDVADIVYNAIKYGYRFIDTAQVYGSEEGVGKAIRKAINEGIVQRRDLFVETKLAPESIGYENAKVQLEQSISKMGLDYVDMYLIHWPVPRGFERTYREKNIETWLAFEELKRDGKCRNIGVCNFLERHILDILDNCEESPLINQLEIHPGFQQIGLVNFCRERGIKIVAWSPMGRGVLNREEYVRMAEKYNKDIGQLALRWSIQKGFIPLTRSSNIEHIKNNMDIWDFEISHEDIEIIDCLNSADNHLDIWSYKRQIMY